MNKIRVMVVDDAVVVRKLITDALSEDPEIEVAGTAANGRIALQKLETIKPDIVTMDIEMPELDGLGTLTELRKVSPKLPVIMFSTLTERGGQATLEALARGASDYVTKPANVGSVREGIARCREELIPKIKALTGRMRLSTQVSTLLQPKAPTPPPVRLIRPTTVHAVVIGVSTGGPVALNKVIPLLPREMPAPVFVVQHMPPVFTRLLAERLSACSQLKVVEAAAGMFAEPGHVYIAPGGLHMTVRRTALHGGAVMIETNNGPQENSCRPAVDVLFRTAAEVYGSGLLGAVMTGMGQDGMKGAEVIRLQGGHIIAQDEASSVVWGMPGAVVNAGLADEVLPLDRIATTLTRRTLSNRGAPPGTPVPGNPVASVA